MRKFFSLLNDNPSDVSVTTLKASVSKRQPVSQRKYFNTLKMTAPSIIGPNSNPTVALVTENSSRALLIIQNDSFATTAGDVAPTMYFGFGMTPVIGQGIGLPPGVGIVLDVRVPSDAIYVTLGPAVNTSGSVVTQGLVQEGGITNPELDTVNISETGQLAALTKQLAALVAQLATK